jgi:hypothetical protein
VPELTRKISPQFPATCTRAEMKPEEMGIRGCGTAVLDCIIDVRVTDTDAKSNLSKDPKSSETHEKKRRNTSGVLLEQRRTFTRLWSPLMVSLARKEDLAEEAIHPRIG